MNRYLHFFKPSLSKFAALIAIVFVLFIALQIKLKYFYDSSFSETTSSTPIGIKVAELLFVGPGMYVADYFNWGDTLAFVLVILYWYLLACVIIWLISLRKKQPPQQPNQPQSSNEGKGEV